MASNRNTRINILQIFIIIMAVIDFIYGVFFISNPESLSAKFNLIINQPEDHLWRALLGGFFIVSSINFFPMLFAPMLYRHTIWLSSVLRPLLIATILLFSTVGASTRDISNSWIYQQTFFLVFFLLYLCLGLVHLLLLWVTRNDAVDAKKAGIQ